jgi:hypothetical protein
MAISSWLPITISGASTTLALIAFLYQVRRARFNQSIDLLFRLENSFFGEDMREQRSKAARLMLRDIPDFTEVEDVIDFFETVALLSRKGALDRYMIWHTFYYWIDRYYETAKSHIEERRKIDSTVWQDIGPFVEGLRNLQVKEAGLSTIAQTIPAPDELKRFLNEEQSEGKPRSRSVSGR